MSEKIELAEYYRWGQYRGMVFACLGHPMLEVYDYYGDKVDEYPDTSQVMLCAVGDDRIEIAHLDDVEPYHGDICSCGQIGCGWGEPQESEEEIDPAWSY